MDPEKEERYSKRTRLRKRNEYLLVQRSGRKVHSEGFIGLVYSQNSGLSRLGVTTSKRIGNAVTRNRLRRLVREAFRQNRHKLGGIDIVVLNQPSASQADNRMLFESLDNHWRRCQAARAEEAGKD